MSDSLAVLFVCTGNLNRSALAAALFRRWADWYLNPRLAARVTIGSAGLAAPVGALVPEPTAAIARELGADIATHRAAQLDERAVRSADLVLVASRRQVDGVVPYWPGALNTTLTIREAGRVAASVPHERGPRGVVQLRDRLELLDRRRLSQVDETGADDVVDPQGKGVGAFVEMARQEVPALANVAALLFGMPEREAEAYRTAVEADDFGASAWATADGRDAHGRRSNA